MKFTDLCKQPRVDLAADSPIPAPLNIYIEPGNTCNLKCSCCPESLPDFFQRQGGRHKLSWADWESVASQIEQMPGVLGTLHFYMLGEPLLYPNTMNFIRDATDRRLAKKTMLTTNGIKLHDRAEEIASSGLTYLRVSLYDEYSEHWPSIALGLDRLMRINPRPFVYVKSFTETPGYDFPCDERSIEQLMNWNGRAGRLGDDHSGPKQACPMPFFTLVIHSNLEVSVCCVDWDRQLKVGDLRKESLMKVWSGDAMRQIRLAHLRGQRHTLPGCRDCTLLHTLQDNVDELSADEYLAREQAHSRATANLHRRRQESS